MNDYIIKPLSPSAARTMLSYWAYSFTETEEGLEERLSKYPAYGAFFKGELVAWTHQYACGMIGMTFTRPDHRRKGLAGVVTLTLAQRIFSEGRIPVILTEHDNAQSISFHKKLGFYIDGQCSMASIEKKD